MGSTSRIWELPADQEPPCPYKSTRSPLRNLPAADFATFAKPDAAHTYAIHGFGKDLVAGGLLMLCHLDVFGSGKLPSRFREAYSGFKVYCRQHGKTTSITEFSFKSLKMQSRLVAVSTI